MPSANSVDSSKKSSTAKSPSREAIPNAAGIVSSRAMNAIANAFLLTPDFFATNSGHSFGTSKVTSLSGTVFFSLFSKNWSKLILSRGVQIPVKTKAENIPNDASIPNDLSAAISLKRLALNAAIVVIDVSRIAFPTNLNVICELSLGPLPRILSSL